MAADYTKLGLDNNLYKSDSALKPRMTAAELEMLISDSELFSAKVSALGAGKLAGGTLGQNEAITGTNGQYRAWKLGRLT